MGACTSRNRHSYRWEKDQPKMFMHKVKALQQEINAILKRREEDSESYERELMLFSFKEAEWKKDRKKLRDEVKRLRRAVEDREERIRLMEDEVDQLVGKTEFQSQFEGKSSSVNSSLCLTATATVTTTTTSTSASLSLMDQIKGERLRRDETVEKWKMLYLAIKNELDELIQKTHEQGILYWRAEEEENLMEELQRDSRAKDEIIAALKSQIVSMENEEYKRRREVDILRQSLKIISNKKGTNHVKSRSRPSIRLNRTLSKFAFVN